VVISESGKQIFDISTFTFPRVQMFPPIDVPDKVKFDDDDDDNDYGEEYQEEEEEEEYKDEEVMDDDELHRDPRHYNVYVSMYGEDSNTDSDVIGTNLSKSERERLNLGTEFVYGEVTYRTMSRILSHVLKRKIKKHGTFVDFGSGTGKPLLSAALLRPYYFTSCVGVEYMESLHKNACAIVDTHYNPRIIPILERMYPDLKMPSIYLERADFTESWSDRLKSAVSNASVLFTHSTMFDTKMLLCLARHTQALAREDVVFVTLSHELPSFEASRWKVVDELFLDMSWGGCVVYVHRLSSSPVTSP